VFPGEAAFVSRLFVHDSVFIGSETGQQRSSSIQGELGGRSTTAFISACLVFRPPRKFKRGTGPRVGPAGPDAASKLWRRGHKAPEHILICTCGRWGLSFVRTGQPAK
jgi:hypothetical protein